MPFATDDLARVLVPQDREFAGFAQGVLREWNGDTFENAVQVRGGVLRNLPVASGVEALTYQSGNVVMLVRWKPGSGRGSASYWIGMGGRVIFPGTGAAAAAIAWMRSSLAKEISAEVFAERMRADSVETEESRASTDYGDLSTVGPTAVDVPVSDSGLAVVWVGAGNKANPDAGAGSSGGYMAFNISGATTRAADDSDSMRCTLTNHNAGGVNQTSTVRSAMAITVSGLNPGLHTFTCKYRAFSSDRPGIFVSRNLVVIGL